MWRGGSIGNRPATKEIDQMRDEMVRPTARPCRRGRRCRTSKSVDDLAEYRRPTEASSATMGAAPDDLPDRRDGTHLGIVDRMGRAERAGEWQPVEADIDGNDCAATREPFRQQPGEAGRTGTEHDNGLAGRRLYQIEHGA